MAWLQLTLSGGAKALVNTDNVMRIEEELPSKGSVIPVGAGELRRIPTWPREVLADHDRTGVGIARDQCRHDRTIDDAPAPQTANPNRAHLAGPVAHQDRGAIGAAFFGWAAMQISPTAVAEEEASPARILCASALCSLPRGRPSSAAAFRRTERHYYPPQPTLIRRGLACSALGRVSVKTPSFISALILPWSTLLGARLNVLR